MRSTQPYSNTKEHRRKGYYKGIRKGNAEGRKSEKYVNAKLSVRETNVRYAFGGKEIIRLFDEP